MITDDILCKIKVLSFLSVFVGCLVVLITKLLGNPLYIHFIFAISILIINKVINNIFRVEE